MSGVDFLLVVAPAILFDTWNCLKNHEKLKKKYCYMFKDLASPASRFLDCTIHCLGQTKDDSACIFYIYIIIVRVHFVSHSAIFILLLGFWNLQMCIFYYALHALFLSKDLEFAVAQVLLDSFTLALALSS